MHLDHWRVGCEPMAALAVGEDVLERDAMSDAPNKMMASQLRYVRADGSTSTDMHINMTKGPLYRLGDCILVWVNESDFWGCNPIDVAFEERDLKEYKRLRAKFATITPALDAAIQDEMTFIPPARCTDKDSCHCHGECMYPGLGCMK